MLKKDQTKLVCLFIFVVGLVTVLLTDGAGVQPVLGFSGGPQAGFTGAPGEQTCATSGCHSGPANSGPGRISVTAPDQYEPGESYTITVRHTTTDNTRRRWGFQLTVLTGGNNKAGDLQRLNNQTSVLSNDGPGFNRQYIEHNSNGTFVGQTLQASWTFNWIAPSTDVGPVTFYAAGNQANNNGNNDGDQIYTTSVTVNPRAPSTTGPPSILNASVSGKKLLVLGENFADGAELLMNGEKQKKTSNDSENPRTLIVAKKSGKAIARGQEVTLQVRNPDGTLSELFTFRRPE